MLKLVIRNLLHKLSDLTNLVRYRTIIFKSRFIEMFGLPGTDIDGKGLSKLSDFVTINPKKNTDIRLSNENLDISFIPMSGVSEKGEILATEIRKVKEVKSGFTYFQDNDVLFAKITPCMENGKGGVAQKLMNGIGFGSTEFHVLRPGNYVVTKQFIFH